MKWIIFFYVLSAPGTPNYEKQVDFILINEHTVTAFGEEWYITPAKVKLRKDTYRDKIYQGFFYLRNGRKRATLTVNGRMAVFTRLGDRERAHNVIVDQLPHYRKHYQLLKNAEYESNSVLPRP